MPWLLSPFSHGRHSGLSISIQGCGYLARDGFGRAAEGIVVEMRMSRGGCRLSVSQQTADNGETETATSAKARVCVSQVMKAHPAQAGTLGYRLPRAFQIMAGFVRIVAWDHIGADPFHAVQHRKGRGVENDGLPTGFAVREEQEATLRVEMLPGRPRCAW